MRASAREVLSTQYRGICPSRDGVVGGGAGERRLRQQAPEGRLHLLLVEVGEVPLLLEGERPDVGEPPRREARGGAAPLPRRRLRADLLRRLRDGLQARRIVLDLVTGTSHTVQHLLQRSPPPIQVPARRRCDLRLPTHKLRLRHELFLGRLPQALALAHALVEVLVDLLQLLVSHLINLRINLLSRCRDFLVRAADHLCRQHIGVLRRGGRARQLHPGMAQGLLGGHALLGVVLERVLQEIHAVLAQLRLGLPSDGLRQDLDHDVPGLLRIVRVVAVHQQVEEHAAGPDVHQVVVLLANELRR
mmetsp:Transcript_28807/g.82498  ORF Transcript_28807/g.82498 Transcript_28807/m.82498 type:complete len:304 (-) Transcript_28807:687-1598(-)